MLLSVTIEGLDAASKGFALIAARASNLSPALNRLGLHHQRKAARILRSGERGVQARNPAGLAASITFAQDGPNGLLVGSNKTYAASQQFGPPGGYYVPVTGKYLAIPVLDNIAARGNPRFKSPRDVENGFFFRSKGRLFFGRTVKRRRKRRELGKPVWGQGIAQPDAGDDIEVLFILLPQTRGTAHRYVTHDPDDQQLWDRMVGDYVLRGRL